MEIPESFDIIGIQPERNRNDRKDRNWLMLSYLCRHTFAYEITGAILLSRSGKESGGE